MKQTKLTAFVVTGFSALLCTGMMAVCIPSAQAGFEFTAPQKAPPAKLAAPAPAPESDVMPALPTGNVTAETLNAAPPSVPDSSGFVSPEPLTPRMPQAQAAADARKVEPVYIHRQRTAVPIKPGQNEPINTSALLKATSSKQPVNIVPLPGETAAVDPMSTVGPVGDNGMTGTAMTSNPDNGSDSLIINPYPLGNNGVHNGENTAAPLEQAMMEETGSLRPVAVPGGQVGNAPRIRQAALSSRANSVSRASDVPAGSNVPFVMSSSLTPIPGGEGKPLNTVEQQPIPPMTMAPMPAAQIVAQPVMAQQPRQAMMGGQISSEQILAAPAMKAQPAMTVVSEAPVTILPRTPNGAPPPPQMVQQQPQMMMPMPDSTPSSASAAPVPLIQARVSSEGMANTPSLQPRPAVPANYPTPSMQMASNAPVASADVNAGGYANAVGFGRDLPLALALSQIVPPDYSFSFAQDVNVGQNVTWQGGKPWNQVLDDMLGQKGMRAVIQNNQVTIQNARS